MKLALFVLGWMFFVSFTPGLGSPWTIGSWWLAGIAFQKAFIWACLIEVLGFGCMSEVVAASVLGWNYGEGHLCDEHLLRAVQSQCHFEDGELRAIVVESQPLLGSSLH